MFKLPAHKSNSAGQIVNKPDTDNWKPPRYLRDVIKAAQERSSEEQLSMTEHKKAYRDNMKEGPYNPITPKQAVELLKNSGVSEAFLSGVAPTPTYDTERRLQARLDGLVRALTNLGKHNDCWWTREIAKILAEHAEKT